MTPRQRQAKWLDLYMLLWLAVLGALIGAKCNDSITNPVPVVLVPLWGPPVVWFGYGLAKRVLRLIVWLIQL